MSDNELPELPELVVLTGAGFFKACGLPLTSEFNTMLYNRLIDNKELTRRIIEERNFEQIYTDLQEEKNKHFEELHNEVKKIFIQIDERCKVIGGDISNNVRDKFFKHYFEGKNAPLRLDYFTLNQDLLYEHGQLITINPPFEFIYPGISQHVTKEKIKIQEKSILELKNKFEDQIPTRALDDNYNNNHKVFFWKLHGSSNWKDENGNLMIFGTNKKEQIKKRPLLKFYMEEFENVIQGKTLLIIGYSFNDSHINNIIFDAANKYKSTKIHIVFPEAKLNSNFYKKLFDAGKIPFMSCLKKGFNKKTNVFLHSYTLEDLFGFTPGENNFPFKLIELYNSLNK